MASSTVALSATPVGSWQLVVGSWQLAVGSWELGVGSLYGGPEVHTYSISVA